jgi:signal transduction histidine kinase
MIKSLRKFIIPLLAAAVLIMLALFADSLYFSNFEYRYRTRLINKILHEKENQMDGLLSSMKPIVASENHHGSETEKDIFSVAARNNITILEYLDNKLTFWSDNDFDVPQAYVDSLFSRPLVFLQNGWFLPEQIESANEKIVGLLRIRADYSLKNDIIKSGFMEEFRLPDNVGFSTDFDDSPFHVTNNKGQFLFSLIFPEVKEPTGLILIPVILWAAAFIIILIVLFRLTRKIAARRGGIAATAIATAGCLGIYFAIIFAGTPDIFPLTELFSPYRFSLNKFIPTSGHLLIAGILCFFISGVFFRYFPVSERRNEQDRNKYFRTAGFFIIASLLLCSLAFLFSRLVLTSGINFQPFRVLELDLMSLAGYLSVFMIVLLPALFMQRIMMYMKHHTTAFMIFSIIPSLVLIALLFRNDHRCLYSTELFLVFLSAGIWFSLKNGLGAFSQTVIFSFIFGLYSLYIITVFTEEKLTVNNKIQAVSFSTENDPEAEQLLLDLWPSISNDTTLAGMMKQDSFNQNNEDVENISDYLRETYFHGYWANFNFNVILCRNDEPLVVGPSHEVFPVCFNFFDERIKRDGHRLSGTGFYFIDNQRGRSFYLGRLIYRSKSNYLHGLFIELYGDVNVFQPGYSALLLDEKYKGYSGLKDYSFAKYINGEIVLRAGEFPYQKSDGHYVENVDEYRVFREGRYRHVLYKNGNSTVIISRPLITAGNMVISFAYLFAFILLFSNITVLVVRWARIKAGGLFNFRQKLQLSYIVILLFSFILIGVVVAYLTINSYKSRHYENIKEKLNSVYLELDSRLSNEKRLNSNWRNSNYSSLNDLMISLSNIFNTDINLYSVDGSLLATSRPEIFIRNLTSSRINNEAWTRLRDQGMTEFYQREKIGNLEYLSAYIPFFNSEDVVLAYVNLPYFRIQSVLAKEISNLVVAVVNFALLLILVTMGIAVVISGRITAPLSMLGKGLASVQLGRKTEHLSYSGNDEIAELVRQYNRMLDELEDSARKLANSEREYAWREMAKQIAHEIKNPLTPMKLNVQQLLKSWKDKVPDFNERLEHFTINQIEYIDNLSSIASAFSSFAKMPTANPSEVNLPDQIRITLDLFRDAEDITFNVEWPHERKVVVWADKEHLNGIFSNLIKNGIQSIPPGRKGMINLKIEVRSDKVVVSVSDNGTGIPKEVQAKLFTPNFTTKSSGTGLGLSIIRKYVETAGGRIWFESSMGKGSTFFVELPLKYTVEGHV